MPGSSPDTHGGSWSKENIELSRLLEQAASGRADSFETLYLSTARWLLYEIRHWVSERDAEDVLADVYLQLWLDARKFDATRAPPIAWMKVIARSRALDHVRRCRPDPVQPSHEEQISDDDPETTASLAESQRLLHVCLASAGLNAAERAVLCLAYFGENTQQEISSVTGLPLATVKSTMQRARRKLRAMLARLGPPAGATEQSA